MPRYFKAKGKLSMACVARARENFIPDLFKLFLCIRGWVFIGVVLRSE